MALLRFLLVVIFFAILTGCSEKEPKSDFANCFTYDQYELVETRDFPDTPTRRSILLKSGSAMLSVQQGFRFTFSYKGQRFLDVAIEYPADSLYHHDKDLVKQHFEYLSTEGESPVTPLSIDGLQGYELDRNQLHGEAKFISISSLFDDENGRIAYIYFRKISNYGFDSLEEFSAHKNEILKEIASCLKD